MDTAEAIAEDLRGRVLHRDGAMLIVNKPPGLAVHAGPGGGLSLEDGFDGLRFGYRERPGLAHRLDRDTSGCLVLGRHAKALRRLNRLFAEGRVAKLYWAIVRGAPPQPEGEVNLALSKISRKSGWRMVVDPGGLAARTAWQTLGAGDGLTWLALRPATGRTHQIRIHCAALGCPILDDPIYGEIPPAPGRFQALHARAIRVPYFMEKPDVAIEAPPPDHMVSLLTSLGFHD